MKLKIKKHLIKSIFLAALTALVIILVAYTYFDNNRNTTAQPEKIYYVINPYENVDWDLYGQYKANFHTHSTNSDGINSVRDMVEKYYAMGYDILGITDHNFLSLNWNAIGFSSITAKRLNEISTGLGRSGNPMISIDYSAEQSSVEHINTFWASFINTYDDMQTDVILKCESLGGISHINHPSRYTGGYAADDKISAAASNNITNIKKYTNIFLEYSSCVGMEIISKLDSDSKGDRILWDNILERTTPHDRFVWGFAGDDAHSREAAGYAWNVMLMPELNQAETRTAMENGAFYAVSRVSRFDGINRYYPDGVEICDEGNESTLYLLGQSAPGISRIEVIGSTIAISGTDYDTIEWIADGAFIAVGETIELNDYLRYIGSYVRAQLKSETGIAFTQPFGIKKIALN